MEQGLTIIYWGYGKGKTTAAIGLALRALGQGQRLLFMQFMKGEEWRTGEAIMLARLSFAEQNLGGFEEHVLPHGAYVEFHIVGKGWVRIMGDQKPIMEHQEAAREGLAFAKSQITNNKFQIVILDEILSAVDEGLLNVNDIKDLIRAKPLETHLVMTGHKAYSELIEMADVVTNMEKIKHPYDKGVLAQKGIDY